MPRLWSGSGPINAVWQLPNLKILHGPRPRFPAQESISIRNGSDVFGIVQHLVAPYTFRFLGLLLGLHDLEPRDIPIDMVHFVFGGAVPVTAISASIYLFQSRSSYQTS